MLRNTERRRRSILRELLTHSPAIRQSEVSQREKQLVKCHSAATATAELFIPAYQSSSRQNSDLYVGRLADFKQKCKLSLRNVDTLSVQLTEHMNVVTLTGPGSNTLHETFITHRLTHRS